MRILYLLVVLLLLGVLSNAQNPLFDYINKADPTFDLTWTYYKDPRVDPKTNYSYYYLNFTSQKWLDESYVDLSIWSHKLAIAIPPPDQLHAPDLAALYVTGGSMHANEQDFEVAISEIVGGSVGGISAVLNQIPSSPISFKGANPVGEDKLVATTWAYFAENVDKGASPETIINLPMVKAVVRAMDIITEFTRQNMAVASSKFYLAGASKRGCAVALAACYEGSKPASQRRVIGVAPIVYDIYDFSANILRMRQLYGGWSMALEPYLEYGAMRSLGTWRMDALASIIDPLSRDYTKSYANIPKLLVSASGDEFFVIDNDKSYWHKMPGESHRLIAPNAEHAMVTGLVDALTSISGHITSLYYNIPLPQQAWYTDPHTGELRFEVSRDGTDIPIRVSKWQANTNTSIPARRDFRMIKKNLPGGCLAPAFAINEDLCFNAISWKDIELERHESGNNYLWSYVEKNPPKGPDDHWTGYFIMADYSKTVDVPVYGKPDETRQITITQKYTTQATVWPDILPFPPCTTFHGCPNNMV